MTRLTWNDTGKRYFETGVDQGVFYTSEGVGIPWDGLISVSEKPSGGEVTPFYMDGIKYLNVTSSREFGGSIEAYTYPPEFAEYDGYVVLDNGISVDEQEQKAFGFSYRTLIGNDIDNERHGYKLHIVYNALATPSASDYKSMGANAEPLNFNWTFTTTPIQSATNPSFQPLSHVVIDSRTTHPSQLRLIESILYGVSSYQYERYGYMYVVSDRAPRMPTVDELFALFATPLITVKIQADPTTGRSMLIETNTVKGDLTGRFVDGRFIAAEGSRLTTTAVPGLYTLEP